MHTSLPPPAVTWGSVPRKDQLFILFLCRVADFFQQASIQAFVFFQLQSFDPALTDAQVSTQAGVLQGCFTGAMVLTAVFWGKAADAPWGGRKFVIVLGLAGTGISCVGYGFSNSFASAAFWRIFGGAVNGTVLAVRTTVAEATSEKKYLSRAFLILPMSFNVANAIGPIMGGFLADAATTSPSMFAGDGVFAFAWIRTYPYALPNVINAAFLFLVTTIVFFFLEETSITRKGRLDLGCHLRDKVLGRRQRTAGYSQLQSSPDEVELAEDMSTRGVSSKRNAAGSRHQPPFRRVLTRNVILTMLSTGLFEFHLGAFQNLWSLLLSTPRTEDSAKGSGNSPLSGGMGMSPATVGGASSIIGFLGVVLQLALYPPVNARLGTLKSYRYFLVPFLAVYFLAPLLVAVPAGAASWAGIVGVLLLAVTARTFTMPASIILVNNCCPHPVVLATIHGIDQSVAAGCRTLGPIVAGWWYGVGLDAGNVAYGWWAVAAVSAMGCVSASWIYEGTGNEIVLEGD